MEDERPEWPGKQGVAGGSLEDFRLRFSSKKLSLSMVMGSQSLAMPVTLMADLETSV